MSNLKEILADTMSSWFGKVAVLAVSLGWVPFALLSMAHKAVAS